MDELDANVSSKEGFRSVEKVVLLTFLSAVILMAILGNLLVMVAVCRDRQLRKIKTNYFIVSLAFADLLVSVLVMPFGAIELVQDIWIYGEMFCLVRTSLDVLLTTASIFHLCCISLDRYYAICCQPLVYRNKMTPLRIALMLGGCWLIPMFISFLPIMQGWNNIGIIDLERIHKPRLGEDLHVIEKKKVPPELQLYILYLHGQQALRHHLLRGSLLHPVPAHGAGLLPHLRHSQGARPPDPDVTARRSALGGQAPAGRPAQHSSHADGDQSCQDPVHHHGLLLPLLGPILCHQYRGSVHRLHGPWAGVDCFPLARLYQFWIEPLSLRLLE
ncbi:5-hydroxytryptamine receptor 4 isoform X1 [Phyllostomus discolor]|uniref:5-hydroxytryptamine receptor 4 n=1 Tax=Phyllostomus discolor TaxID=89673 RepID=A0A7E6CSS0_9CHIR|nr:5-hydroxytryptamine receptor 4 isoform X1 [Phyllostomus discolor]